jgi:hypothetical protein
MDADLFLTPLSSDVQQQLRAHKLLGTLLHRTEEKQLPPMRWAISSTGTLIAEPVLPDAEIARPAYETWVVELRIVSGTSTPRDGVTHLRALGTVDGVHITVEAKIYGTTDSSED